LTVLGGPQAGTSVVLDETADEILIGSDPDCKLALDLPGVSPIHARLSQDALGLTVYDTRSPHGLYVNDDRVSGEARLNDGDVLWLGPPGGAESVMIQCRVPSGLPDFMEAPVTVEPSLADAVPAEPAAPSLDDPEFFFDDLGTAVADPVEAVPAFADLETLVEATPAPDPAAPPREEPAPRAAAVPAPPAPVAAVDEDVFFVDEPAPPQAQPESAPFVVEEAPVDLHDTGSHDAAFLVDEPLPEPPAVTPPVSAPPQAPPAAATPPPPLATAPPPPRPAAPARRAPGPPAAARPAASRPAPARGVSVPRWAPLALLALIVLGVGAYFGMGLLSTPSIDTVSPARAGLGQTVTLTGRRFAAAAQDNDVRLGGRPARVVQASGERLQVEVPELPVVPGRDTPVPVVVAVRGRESKPATLGVYLTPRVHGISPNVAMPGDEVRLSGAGWGKGAKVRFGDAEAEVLEATPSFLRVKVPALEGGTGREVPVVVTMGADSSNTGSFVVGRLPLVTGVEPQAVTPGDLLTVRGRGFAAKPAGNQVQIGGARALVVSVGASELKVVVPRGSAAGQVPLELRVPGSENVGQATLTVTGLADPVELRFIAEPFEDVPGHDHAVLATGIGPAFVLTGGPGAPAAERAAEAARRLNDAAEPLKASRDLDFGVAAMETEPALVLAGRDTPLLEVTEADAHGYDEDWTGLKGKGGAVTRPRLAAWWEAVAKDLVLLLVRGDKPAHAAALAGEGKVFGDLHALARKGASVGVPREVMASVRPALREGLRIVAFRVPASVTGPGGAAAAPAGPPLKLNGTWNGSVTEDGVHKYVTVTFDGDEGAITYRRALSLTVPLQKVEQARKGTVRFVVQTGAGDRFYQGSWDGQKLAGEISAEPAGGSPVGTFELTPAR
jgi:hypothetical protein